MVFYGNMHPGGEKESPGSNFYSPRVFRPG
jgi:hypothetical protein